MGAGTESQRKYNIPSGRGVWKKQLIEQFPDEKKAIEKFLTRPTLFISNIVFLDNLTDE